MILAVSVPEKLELVIVAGKNLDDQRGFLAQIQNTTPELIQDTDISRYLIDPDLSAFKLSPTILEFPSTEDLNSFVDENSIELTNFSNAHARQARMLSLEEFNSDTGGRTLGEIYGLDTNDPFDRRTDEEKAEMEKLRKDMQDKRKSGDLTDDSWGGRKAKGTTKTAGTDPIASGADVDPDDEKAGGLRIRDISITVNDDGTVSVGRVLADKDLFAADMFHLTVVLPDGASRDITDYEPILKRAGLAATNQSLGHDYEKHEDGGIIIDLGGAALSRIREALEESGREYTLVPMIQSKEGYNLDNPYRITDDNMVEVYFRVNVSACSLDHASTILSDENVRTPFRANEVGDDCWLAYVREATAEDAVKAFTKHNVVAVIEGVDPEGTAIIEAGADARVLDTGAAAVEPPAPWNDRAAEYYALSEEDRQKSIKGQFLLYSMRDYGAPHRLIVHITPKSYFNEHEKIWDGDLPIEHLMPDNFAKFGDKPGVYQCKSLDLNTADFMLGNRAHMKESLNLRAHINTLGRDAQ